MYDLKLLCVFVNWPKMYTVYIEIYHGAMALFYILYLKYLLIFQSTILLASVTITKLWYCHNNFL